MNKKNPESILQYQHNMSIFTMNGNIMEKRKEDVKFPHNKPSLVVFFYTTQIGKVCT